jgi:hypothetical protein
MLDIERGSATDSRVILELDGMQVRELDFSNGEADVIWNHIQGIPTMFTDFSVGDRELFDAVLFHPKSYCVGVYQDDGLIGVARLEPRGVTDALVHVFFFQKGSLSRYVSLCRDLLIWIFRNWPYYRLSIEVPVMYYHVIRFAETIGFTSEGRRRSVYLMRGRWYDEALYGILRSEVI